MSPLKTRGRSRSQSDVSEHSKSSAGAAIANSGGGDDSSSPRRRKRDRAESGGDLSVLPKASSSAMDDNSNSNKSQVEKKGSRKKDNQETKTNEKVKPVMDVVVHRMRYLKFLPKPIVAMKATPAWSKHNLLALSRDNGHIELKSLDEKLRTLTMIPGKAQRPVHSLAWIQATAKDTTTPLLVGATREGNIFVVNFAKQAFTNVTPSGGGGIFALESLSAISGCEAFVAAGCEDGSVRVFQYLHEQRSFVLVSSTPSAGAPVLSLAWSKRYVTGVGLDGLVVFAAVADGTIRRFNNLHKKWKSATRMTVESRGRNIPTNVWALKCLQDGTLVSANSLGQVQFWDSETGALEQSIEQSDAKADVLDLAVSSDESKVFASGVDHRVICIERQLGTEHPVWFLTHAQRPHTNDVKCVEMGFKSTTERTPDGNLVVVDILVTGGIDTKLCTYHVGEYYTNRPRNIYPWPTFSPVFMSKQARMVGIMREKKIDLYRLPEKDLVEQCVVDPIRMNDQATAAGTVEICHESNLACAAMSNDGRYLAVANMGSFFLFSISFDKNERLKAKQLPIKNAVKSPVTAIKFVQDTTAVLSCADGSTLVVPLEEEESGSDIESRVQRYSTPNSTIDTFAVHTIVSSPSGAYFATLKNSLQGTFVDIFSRAADGAIHHVWTVPKLDTPIIDACFLNDNHVAVVCLDFALVVFDIKEKRLHEWNIKAGVRRSFPGELRHRRDHPVRVFPHGDNPNKVVVGAFGVFAVFSLDEPFPTACRNFPDKHVRSSKKPKRARSASQDEGARPATGSTITLCLSFNSMLYLDFVGEREMVVVEEPWVEVTSTFPPALERRIYGT